MKKAGVGVKVTAEKCAVFKCFDLRSASETDFYYQVEAHSFADDPHFKRQVMNAEFPVVVRELMGSREDAINYISNRSDRNRPLMVTYSVGGGYSVLYGGWFT